MLNRPQVKTDLRQRGFSLVELMISIVIGLILTAGMIQLFVANKQAYRLQEELVVQEENARFSLQTLGFDLRMAGHWGGVPVKDLSEDLGMAGCEKTLIVDQLEDISGYEGGGAPPICNIDADEYVSNSDVIVMRYAAVNERVTTVDLNNTDNITRPIIGSIAGFGGVLDEGGDLQKEEQSGGKLFDAETSLPSEGVYNFPLYTAAYFIRPCSVQVAGSCAGADGIPTLTRLVLRGNSFTQEAVAEGVETMQVEYGIGDINGNISEYMDADEMAAGDWDNVSAVRIGLLVRGDKMDFAFEDSHTTDADAYQMPGNDVADNYKVSGDNKHYRRKLITQVVRVRNKGKG